MTSTPKKSQSAEHSPHNSPAAKKLRSETNQSWNLSFGNTINMTVTSATAHSNHLPTIVANAIPAVDNSVVVIVVASDSAEEGLNALRSAQATKTGLISALRCASGGLIDSSFFIVDSNGSVVGTINKVPIVLTIVGPTDAAGAGPVLASIGSLSLYLTKYYGPDHQKATEGDSHDEPVPELTAANLPFAAMYTRTSEGIQRVMQKIKVATAGTLHSMALYHPSHDIEHLVRQILRGIQASEAEKSSTKSVSDKIIDRHFSGNKQAVDNNVTIETSTTSGPSYSIVYCGAAWCPPCMRIIKDLPSMATGFKPLEGSTDGSFAPSLVMDATISAGDCDIPFALCSGIIKADYDTSGPILGLFGIETIPTFVVIDNQKLVAQLANSETSVDDLSSFDKCSQSLKSSLAAEPLQNSQRAPVSAYFQKVCTAPLCIDEDF